MSDNGMEKPTTSSNLKKKKKKSAKANGEKVKIGKGKKSQPRESEDPNKAQPAGSTAAEFSDEEDFRCAAATPTILSDEESTDAQAQKDGSPKAMDEDLLREQTKELLGIGSSSDNEYEDFNNDAEVEDYSYTAASPDPPINARGRGNQPASFNDAVTDTEEDFRRMLAKHEREMRDDVSDDSGEQDFRAPATPQKVAPDNPPMGLSEDEDQDFRCSVLTPGARSEENLLTRESAQAQVLANGTEPAKEKQVDDGQAEKHEVEANEPDEALLMEQTKELLGIGQSSDDEYEDISNDGEGGAEDYPDSDVVEEASPDPPKVEKDVKMNEAEVYKMLNGLPPALLATIAPSHPNVLAAANASAEKPPTPPPVPAVEKDVKIDDAEVAKILERFPREVLAKIAPSHPSVQAAAQENAAGEQSTSSIQKEVPIKRYTNEEMLQVRKSRTNDEWLGYLWTNHGKHWAIDKYPFELDPALRCAYSDRLRVQRKREEESRRYYAANSANSSRQMPAPVMAANPQQSTKERPKYVRPGQQPKPARPSYVRPGAQNMSALAVDRNENRDSYESTSSSARQNNNFGQRGGKVAQKKAEVIKFCPVERKPDWTESEEDVEDLEGNEIKIQYVRPSSSTGTKEKETVTKSSGAEPQKKPVPAGSDAEYESAEEGYTPPEDFPQLMTFQAMQEHVNQFCALHKHTLQNYFREINKGIKELNLVE